MAEAGLLVFVCSGMKRSASTWSYNVCRELLQRTIDPAKASLVATYAVDTDATLAELGRAKDRGRRIVALIKAHEIGPQTTAAIRQGRLRNIHTLRDPRDALASMVRFWPPSEKQPFDVYVRNFQRWLIQGEILTEGGTSLVIRYEEMVADSRSCVAAMARYLKIPRAPAGLIAAVDAATSAEELQKAVARIEREAEDPEAAFDPLLQLHRRHIDSGEIGRWRHELSPEERQKAVLAFLPWLLSLNYAEPELRAAAEALV